MTQIVLLSLVAVICGSMIAVQASTNTVLLQYTGHVLWTAVILLCLGFIALLSFTLIFAGDRPTLSQIQAAPNWSLIGGIIVASYVVIITLVVPKLGVANAILLIVFGQILASVTIDHFGWFNVGITEISPQRIAGLAFVLGGVYLARS